ncbi:hypothetical protein SUGI_0216190 [Cryptomeria japonica]|nr:hypothetical protein SUGI_0216190 [Cryptomeria japonica]
MASWGEDHHGYSSSPKSERTESSSEDLNSSANSPKPKQNCLCSPTTHEGSFRCRLHRSSSNHWGKNPLPAAKQPHHAKSMEAL